MTTVERKERDSLFFVSPSSNWQIESAADIDLIVRTGILPALSSFRSDSEGITWRERERERRLARRNQEKMEVSDVKRGRDLHLGSICQREKGSGARILAGVFLIDEKARASS